MTDVEAFRAAWAVASKIEASERPNAAILAALDRLAEGVRAGLANGSTVDASLRPFQTTIGKGDGSTSDPASLDATAFREGDRWLVDVRMGYASSVSAVSLAGKRLTLPPELRWSYRLFGPFLRTGRLIAFDAVSLSDAGVRYEYRFGWLGRTTQGYVAAGHASGAWTYGDSTEAHLAVNGSSVSLTSLDTPRSFFTSNAERALRKTETWDANGRVARMKRVRYLDQDVRAADTYLWTHRGAPLDGTRRLPKEMKMVDEIKRGKGWVQLSLDDLTLRFFLARRNGKTRVVKVVQMAAKK